MELPSTSFFVSFPILCVILSLIRWHMGRRRLYEMASKLEGPPVLPFVGNAYLFAGDTEEVLPLVKIGGTLLDVRTILLKNAALLRIAELTETYASPLRAWMGHRLFVIVSEPEQIKVVYLSPKALNKGNMYKFGRPVFGNGLLTVEAPQWRIHRKLIQPTFNTKILNAFAEVFTFHSKMLTNRMEKKLNGPEFEVFNYLATTSLDMLFETVMGIDVGAQTNDTMHYVEALQKSVATVGKRLFSLWLHPDFIFNLSKLGRDQKREIKVLHEFVDRIIQSQKIKNLESRNQPTAANIDDDGRERKPEKQVFLDALLEVSEGTHKWSDEELHDEVNTMMIAGFDTTAVTNSFVMLMLASHPDVQDKVYEELYEIYGDAEVEDCPVTNEDLPRMEYLERVIKETMRLFPVLPLASRLLSDDLIIGDRRIPKDTEVLIPTIVVHRNEKYWPDPLRFDPDRFLPDEITKRHPHCYLPFSAGPRICLGMRYAIMAMKTLHATILRRFILKKDNIVPVKDLRLRVDVVLKAINPITLRIEKRKRNSAM